MTEEDQRRRRHPVHPRMVFRNRRDEQEPPEGLQVAFGFDEWELVARLQVSGLVLMKKVLAFPICPLPIWDSTYCLVPRPNKFPFHDFATGHFHQDGDRFRGR